MRKDVALTGTFNIKIVIVVILLLIFNTICTSSYFKLLNPDV